MNDLTSIIKRRIQDMRARALNFTLDGQALSAKAEIIYHEALMLEGALDKFEEQTKPLPKYPVAAELAKDQK